MTKNWLHIVFVVWWVLVAGCNNDIQSLHSLNLQLKPCRVKGVGNEVQCGTLEVFENREKRSGRKISLNVVVLPASATNKEPDPIFIFAGGPGQAAAELAREVFFLLGRLNNKRDLVLVDQRGTGKSNGLDCDFPEPTPQEMMDSVKRDAANQKTLATCRAKLEENADLTQYTTTIAVADIDDVREALNYPIINLWGASYGTRAAMEYLRRYESRVRSVVLDGVMPPSLKVPENFARDAGQALQKMFVACAGEPSCAKRYADIKNTLNELVTSLSKNPIRTKVVDSFSGIGRELVITKETLLSIVFSALYVPDSASMLPALLTKAKGGDYSALLTLGGQFDHEGPHKIARGMQLAVICAEDLPRFKDDEVLIHPPPFDQLFLSEFQKACENWPRGAMAKDFDQPVKSSKPVLILSGGLDPVTPPQNGEEVKKSFSNSLHAVAPNIGHGVTMHGCAPRLIKSFVESASVDGLDAKCLEGIPRPLFFAPLIEKPKSANTVLPKKYAGKK